MKSKQHRTKQPERVYHSIHEIRADFYPNFYEKDMRKMLNPETLGESLTQGVLERLKDELQK